MTQQEFNTQLSKAKGKGLFWNIILQYVLPWIWENRSFILDLLRKNEKEESKNQVKGLLASCNKNNINDPHYGECGYYTRDCTWIACG